MGAVNRMRNLALSKGWEKWQYEYKELTRLRKLMKGTVRRMLMRQLSRAFEKWQSEVQNNPPPRPKNNVFTGYCVRLIRHGSFSLISLGSSLWLYRIPEAPLKVIFSISVAVCCPAIAATCICVQSD